MLRAWASNRAMVCSAADRMFDWGAFTTMTPRSVAALTSTLSRPMPARPTTTRSAPASSTSRVTWVAERMMRRSRAVHDVDQLVGVDRPEPDIDHVAGVTEPLEPAVGDLLGHEDARHRAQVWPGVASRQPTSRTVAARTLTEL